MDPLSDVFGLLQVKAVLSARFEAGGDWAVHFAPQPQIKFGAALRGSCWLTLHGGEPCRLEAGDTYLMTNCPTYVLASDPSQPPVDGSALYASAEGNAVHYIGNDTVLLAGSFLFDESNVALLMDVLPALIHIPADNPASKVLRETLHLLDDELGAHRMGTSIVTSRLGDILLIQALRAYVASRAPAGWLGALGDPKIGKALRLMHADVRQNWRVGELAASDGMSRSDFARKFKDCVGLPPLDYLIRWRMHLARDALRKGDKSVAAIASSIGYSSEGAFGNAFKRIFGRAPKRYWARLEDLDRAAETTPSMSRSVG